MKYDIAIPITKPRLVHNVRRLSELDPKTFDPIYERQELSNVFCLNLKMEFAVTETEVHQADIAAVTIPMTQELLSSLTKKVVDRAKLTGSMRISRDTSRASSICIIR